MQGAFRKVAVEAAACAKELTATLKKRMLLRKEEAAECIQMLRKLGEPVEALQVPAHVPAPTVYLLKAQSASLMEPLPYAAASLPCRA
jgi:hypothetical protein